VVAAVTVVVASDGGLVARLGSGVARVGDGGLVCSLGSGVARVGDGGLVCSVGSGVGRVGVGVGRGDLHAGLVVLVALAVETLGVVMGVIV